MSRGDEFEAGAPPARRKTQGGDADVPRSRKGMSDAEGDDRADDDRDDDRRMKELREERERTKPKTRSGAVTAVGILALVFGSLLLICGGCGALCGAGIAGGSGAFTGFMNDFMKQAAQQDPNLKKDPKFQQMQKDLKQLDEKMGPTGWFALAEGGVDLLCGGLLLFGGVGVLRRVNLCRFIVPVVPLFSIVTHIATMAIKAIMGPFTWQEIGGGGFWIVINLVFMAFAGFILLTPKYAKEFAGEVRSQPAR